MGAFDDLIPTAAEAKGAFSDLIPDPQAARGAFADMIPDEPPANEDFDSHVNWTRGKFPQLSKPEAIRMVAEKFRRNIPADPTAFDAFKDTVSELPGEATKGFVKSAVIAPLRFVSRAGQQFTEDTNQTGPREHVPAPLERLANALDTSTEVAFPSPAVPGLEHAVAQGTGQIGSLLTGGAALKAIGAGPKVIGASVVLQGGVNEFDDAFGRAVERGDDADTAFAKSLGYGTVAGLIENRLGAGRLWRQMFPTAEVAAQKLTALGVSRTIAGNVLAGGFEEGSQRFAQNLIVDEKPSLEGVMDEAVPGAILEGALGLPGGISQNVAANEQYQNEQANAKALEAIANESALQASLPVQNGKLTANRAADQSFVKGAFDDLIPQQPASEAQPQKPETASNSRPPGTVATPAPAGASVPNLGTEQQNQVKRELEALPGANQDLMRQAPALTTEQTDAGLREQPAADDNVPATKADLKALADFIQNGGQNPFAAAPKATEAPRTPSQPVKNTSPETVQTGVNGATGDLTGSSTSPRAVTQPQAQNPVNGNAETTPLKVGDRIAATERDEEGFASDVQPTVSKQLDSLPVGSQVVHKFTGNVYEKHKSGEWRHRPDLKRAGNSNQDEGTASAAGLARAEIIQLGPSATTPDFIAQETPAATKIEIKNGDTVSVVTRKGAKPRAARVLQLQPDGSAQVVVAGEQTARWLTKDQITPSRRAVTQQAKADELAGFAPEQQTQIKERAAEFRQLVEDYAPQLEWTPAEAYDESFGTDTKDVGFRKAELRANAIRQAMRAVFPNGQENSQVDQANALPALERYLKEKFPGDNSVAKRRALEQFSRSEANPEQTASVKRDQATLDQLAANRPDKPEFRGLRAVGRTVSRGQRAVRGRGTGAGVLPSAGASTVTELERIFGVRIIFVENARFNGVRINGTNLVLINAKSPRATMAIAGHELLHHIKAVHHGLYADFVANARALLKNSEQFRSELAAKGYTNISEALVEEEMFADVLGDAVLDPTFLQQLAKSEPNLFKRFARTAATWLQKLIAKAKAVTGFDSAQYVTDLEAMRHELLNLLRDAGRETQFDRVGIEADAGQFTEQGQDTFARQPDEMSKLTPEQKGKIERVVSRWSISGRGQIPDTVYRGVRSSGEGGGMSLGRGLYTTTDKAQAKIYTKDGGEVLTLPASESVPSNPLVVRDALSFGGMMGDIQEALGYRRASHMEKELSINDIVEALGFDGVQVGRGNGAYFVKYRTLRESLTVEGDRFSMGDGDLFGAPESVAEQRSRLKAEAAAQKLKKAKEAMQERAGARLLGKDMDTTQEMFGAEVKRDKSGQGDMFSREAGPLWRSNIQGALASWQNKGTPEQLRAHLAKTRGAMDEAEWIGLDEFLNGKSSVTKQEVADFVAQNAVDVREVMLGDNYHRAELEEEWNQLREKAQAKYGPDYYYKEGFIGSPERNRMREIETESQAIDNASDGKTKFENYQLPGGENYWELLLTLPDRKNPFSPPEGYEIKQSKFGGDIWDVWKSGKQVNGTIQGKQRAIDWAWEKEKTPTRFQSSHFDEPNILAHVRFNERTDADGKRVLHLEEVQSDWHQKGRKDGYNTQPNTTGWKATFRQRNDSTNTYEVWRENGTRAGLHEGTSPEAAIKAAASADSRVSSVPDAPFKQTWPMLAMKRMIRYAADNGFDRITWTTGEQQAERYDLSKQVDQIAYYPNTDGTVKIQVAKNGSVVMSEDNVTASRAEDMVGKEITKKIFDGEGKEYGEGKVLSGLDLKVGGEGMKGFYDKILPSEVNKFVKKWGGRVGRSEIPAERPQPPDDLGEGLDPYEAQAVRDEWRMENEASTGARGGKYQVHSLDITPAMKGAAMEGFDMFSREESQSEFTKLQADITAAEAELMAAIRQHMNPPEGMRKAEALEAKNDAHRKLRDLLRQQLKMMTDIRNLDAARSPEETANLISQTVDLLNSIQDDISERTAKAEAVPADLTKLRTDLQERLAMLKGWTDSQEDEARSGKVEKATESSRARFLALESATDPQHKTFGEWWQTIKNGLRYLTSPIPELPLTGERAEKSALFRRGYRLFAVENNRVRKEAAERVNQVLEPLTKLGRPPASNEALRKYYQLGEARERAAMDQKRRDAIAKEMLALEESTLNKDPFNLFRRLVLYKDLRWRGTYLKNDAGKPITLPMGLTVDEVASELRRTYKLIENHPDGLAITEALRRHYKLTDDLQKSILEHGEIIPESLRNPLYFPHHVIDSWSGNIARVRPSTEEDFRKYLIAPTGSAKLIQTDYLKAMYLHTADVLAHNARVDLVDKYWKPYDISEQLKTQHGDKWNLPWNIPPGYKVFTPFNKLPLRMDYVLSREVLADKLGVLFNDGDLRERMGDTGRVLKVKPEDLHAAMVAGEKIQWVLPAEIADALNGIARREAAASNPGLGHAIGLPFRAVNNFWKKTKLFAPWNWVRYEYGNLSTDAIDKVLAADPGAGKYLSRAAKEIWNADTGKQSPEYQAAAREGVFDTITAGEAGELTKLPEFKAFLTGSEARWDKVRSFLERPMRGSKFRESVFRYAKFLADVERLRAGKEPTYAGAFHGDIEALGEDVDGQRRMLEGDELIYAKAAEISLKTYGDYNSLGVAGQWLRQYAVPFWSWQDVNFRYHANQLRNIADGLLTKTGPELNTQRKAALRFAGVRVVSTLLAIGIAKELWNQFGVVAAGLADDDDDLEAKLSEADRRRGHLIVGKDKAGKMLVVYTPSAWSDVAEWMGGQNMKRLFMEYVRGQITMDQFIKDYAKQMPRDVLNKLGQSLGPLGKALYESISGKSTFPDVLDQRNIPAADKWWRLVGTLTDDRAVNVLRAAFDKDYYSQPAAEQLQQIILQIRRRDPEQWSYYEAREDAADWKEAKTGKRFEQGSYDAPEAQALRNFRKAIYRGDVASAERFYGRLLQFGYTAERLDASIRNQAPLSDLNEQERAEYVKTLTAKQRQELELATKYYNRLKALDGREKQLFPKKGQKPSPKPELLKRIVEDQKL